VAGQLQNPEDPHDPEDLDHAAHVLELVGGVLVGLQEEQRHEVRHDGEEVDDVEATLEELPLVRGRGEAEGVLEGEPGDADRLHHGEVRVVLDARGGVVVDLQLGERVEGQGDSGKNDEQDRNDGDHLKMATVSEPAPTRTDPI